MLPKIDAIPGNLIRQWGWLSSNMMFVCSAFVISFIDHFAITLSKQTIEKVAKLTTTKRMRARNTENESFAFSIERTQSVNLVEFIVYLGLYEYSEGMLLYSRSTTTQQTQINIHIVVVVVAWHEHSYEWMNEWTIVLCVWPQTDRQTEIVCARTLARSLRSL